MNEVIIDIHAHILPEVDDGAESWEEACAMLDIAISMGIRTIIATPHYSKQVGTERIRELVRKLSEEAEKRCSGFKIYAGQELLYSDSIIETLMEGNALTLADSRYVLVEFLPDVAYSRLYQGIRRIMQGGYYPILAHVERYGVLRQDQNIEELLKMGCLLQMNYSGFCGTIFDKNVRWCRSQLGQRRIHLLGTDMHHRSRRSPVIDKSIAWLARHIEPDYIRSLTNTWGAKIVKKGQSKEGLDGK